MTAAAVASDSGKDSPGEKTAARGLKGVVAADSTICDVDCEVGKLIYRGYNIHDLAKHSTFEETAYLLFQGELPDRKQLDDFNRLLVHLRRNPPVRHGVGTRCAAKKSKFMGFGHAVYQVEDPRAVHLKDLSRRLGIETGEPKWYEISIAMEQAVKAAIKKHCNVDFYSANLQHSMGIPGDMFTCVFAASRIVGWCAHVLEQISDNKIIRPSSNYIGVPDRSYAPLSQR